MKKYLILMLASLFVFNITNTYSATEVESNPVTIKIIEKEDIRELTRGETLTFLGNYFREVPKSYRYISLKFLGVEKDSDLYYSLQKLVYLDLIENKKTNIYGNKKVNAYVFYKLSEKILGKQFIDIEETSTLKERNAGESDLRRVINSMKAKEEKSSVKSFKIEGANKKLEIKQAIFIDTYNTLLQSHYDKNNIDEIKVWNSAIEGVAKGANDKYTAYFPPVVNQNFHESLNGEYEGIGSYVDMEKPGEVKIVSPLTGSPSQKAGLKGGDIITKVDGKEITIENSLLEVVSWIKGPAGTDVILTILREGKTFDITVTRGKIVIKDVEYELLDKRTFYINVRSFGGNVSKNFELALEELNNSKYVNKVIIDLRNNGGGYLDQVSDMLGHFIAKGEITAVVEYLKGNKEYKSAGYDLINFSKYKIVLLQNSGTASASEIMIGTIKDYYPEAIIIGEKSYGKGSVQTIKSYSDGSSLKYTIAKWFTGKSKTGIDGVGIIPDIEIELDMENLDKDEVLEKAKSIR